MDSETIKCSRCNHHNPPNSKYCNHCGSSLEYKEDEILYSKQSPSREAERRQLTILFCDLVGSTPLSEQLDPEDYRQMITGYHHLAEKIVKRYEGHIAQYLGDGLLIYFGYPKGLEDAPAAAIRTGLGILSAVDKANKTYISEGKLPIKIRIGIHSGLVVVDNQLALGDTVNIAARLQGLAPHNGMVISPATLKLVTGFFEVESIGKHALKGISEPMEVYQVINETGVQSRLDIAKGKGLSPLVGRQHELELISQKWENACMGNGNLLLVNGEAGIGKSRLIDSIRDQLSSNVTFRIITAQCSSYQKNSAFYPIIELIEKELLKIDSRDVAGKRLSELENLLLQNGFDIKQTLPLFAEFLSIESDDITPLVISPFAKRNLILENLSKLFENLAQNNPLLFVFEDLHWADASTTEWIRSFSEYLPGKSILLLCTSRPNFQPGWSEKEHLSIINLHRLSHENISKICFHQSNGKSLPEALLNQIIKKTDGVPLFVEELTKMVIESGKMIEKKEEFEIEGSISSLNIPSTLQDSLLARLDRLEDVKDVVQVGSVLGREFSYDMLNAVLSKKAEELDHSLSKLLDAEIFHFDDDYQKQTYRFKHALIQDAAYDSLLKSRRQLLHHKTANILEFQFADIVQAQPELLAHHYTEAGKSNRAIPIWLQAGQKSSKNNAMTEAIAHLQKGMNLLPELPNNDDRKALELQYLLTLGGSYVVAYGFPHEKVKSTFNQARTIAQTMEVSPNLAFVLFNLLSYYCNTEDFQSAKELIDHMMELSKNPEYGYYFEVTSLQIKGFMNVIQGNLKTADECYTRVIERFDPTLPFPWELSPAGYLEIGAKAWWMIDLQIMGQFNRARELFENHLSFTKDHKDSMTLYHIYSFVALYDLFNRDWEDAVKVLDKYIPIVKGFGDPVFILTADVYYHIAQAFLGTRESFDQAIQLMNVCFDIGFKAFAVTMSSLIAELYLNLKEYDNALQWIDKILDHAQQTGSNINNSELLRIKGLVYHAQGKPVQLVEETFLQALEKARKSSAKLFELRVLVDLTKFWHETGSSKDGAKMLNNIVGSFNYEGVSPDIENARAILKLQKPNDK